MRRDPKTAGERGVAILNKIFHEAAQRYWEKPSLPSLLLCFHQFLQSYPYNLPSSYSHLILILFLILFQYLVLILYLSLCKFCILHQFCAVWCFNPIVSTIFRMMWMQHLHFFLQLRQILITAERWTSLSTSRQSPRTQNKSHKKNTDTLPLPTPLPFCFLLNCHSFSRSFRPFLKNMSHNSFLPETSRQDADGR